ncbi:MAG TPA: cohesin domain-containing protein, partial [Clostridium sp.]
GERGKVLVVMKKLLTCFLCFILIIYGGAAKAVTSPSLTVDIKGNIEAGEVIKIIINVDNIESLYAGAATLKYDPKVLKIIGFEKGNLITKGGANTFDVGNKTDNVNGMASFGGFTCVGQTNGFSGSGTFLIINAKVLKKDSFHIRSLPFLASPNEINNLKIQLCNKNVKEVTYKFKGYYFKTGSVAKIQEINKIKTTKDTGWRVLIASTIALVFAVEGVIYFYKKKHQSEVNN